MSRIANVEEKLRALPHQPGVYVMRDEAGKVIYVGKTLSLRNRVRSYFQDGAGDASPKLRLLVARIFDFDVVACENEVEALILETNLIKQHRPKYNVRMADDKSFPYLKITSEPYPKIHMTRTVRRDGARYFGPYPYHEPKLVTRTIRTIRKLFKLRTCKIEIDRSLPRPCLDYYIGQCTAPCVAWGAAESEYAEQVRQASLFLEGKQEDLVTSLRRQMAEASEALAYERAAALRDQVQAIDAIAERQRITAQADGDRDVVAVHVDGDDACALVLFVRGGRLIGQEHYLLTGAAQHVPAEVLRTFLEQFYEISMRLPREVLIPVPIEDQETIGAWLTQRRGARVEVLVPQRGDKRRLVEMATENARLALAQERSRLVGKEGAAVRSLQQALALDDAPWRVEAYDVSNLGERDAVASMVVFERGLPKKDAYRRFKIRSVEGQNDFAMIQEALRRRFEQARTEQERLDREEPVKPKWSILPDLIVIDGGRGQLDAALEVLFEYNQNVPTIGLAKREEHILRADRPEPLALAKDAEALRLLQRIRDEAHRFANAYHRALRGRKIVFSVLDEIPGIGEKRKRDLIREFGSVRRIREASEADVAAVIGPKAAARVVAYLRAHDPPTFREEAVR